MACVSFAPYKQFPRHFDETFVQSVPAPVVNGDSEHPSDRIALMSDCLAWILQHVWLDRWGRPAKPMVALRKFAAIARTLRPDLVGDFEQLAKAIGCSRSALSHDSLAFSDEAGVHFRASRRESVRQRFSDSAKRGWVGRKAKGAVAAPVNLA